MSIESGGGWVGKIGQDKREVSLVNNLEMAELEYYA